MPIIAGAAAAVVLLLLAVGCGVVVRSRKVKAAKKEVKAVPTVIEASTAAATAAVSSAVEAPILTETANDDQKEDGHISFI